MSNLEDNTEQPTRDLPPYYVYEGPPPIIATVLRPSSPSQDQQICPRRLLRELHDISMDPPITISAGPKSLTDIQFWTVMLMIPPNRPSPYAGGIFTQDVHFPIEYPHVPPTLKYTTRILHPNVIEAGEISGMRVLNERNWSPVVVLQHVVLNLEALLGEPDLEEAADPRAAVANV